jgi:hypothetical protein
MPISLKSAEAAVAAAPYLLGFTPADSLVLLLTDDEGLRASLRVDLPDCPDLDWLLNVLARVNDQVPDDALLIVYADTVPEQYAVVIAEWVTYVLGPVVRVIDCLLVHDGAMDSLLEDSVVSGPVPLDSLANHPVVAECVAAGMTRVSRREDLQDHWLPVEDDIAEGAAILLAEPPSGHYRTWRDATEADTLEVVLSQAALTAEDVALLGRACRDVFVRDPLLAMLLGEDCDRELLHRVRARLAFAAARLPDRYAGGVAATAALLTWALGDWAGAYAAADRACEADPTNTLGPLVLDALEHGLPPDTWSTLTRDIPLEVLRGRGRRTA